MTANVRYTVEQNGHLRNPRCPLTGTDSLYLQFNLQSEL